MKAIIINVYRYSLEDPDKETLLFLSKNKSNLLVELIDEVQRSAAFDCIIIVLPESDLAFIKGKLSAVSTDNIIFFTVPSDSKFAFHADNVAFNPAKMFSFPLYGGWNIQCLKKIEELGIKKVLMFDALDGIYFDSYNLKRFSQLIEKGRFSLMLENWSSWLIGADLKELKADVSLFDNKKIKRFKEINESSRMKDLHADIKSLREHIFTEDLKKVFLVEKLRTTEDDLIHELKIFKKELLENKKLLSLSSTFFSSIYNKYLRDPKSSFKSIKDKVTVPEIIKVKILTEEIDYSYLYEWYQAKVFYLENSSTVINHNSLKITKNIKKISAKALVYWEESFKSFTEIRDESLMESYADVFVLRLDKEDVLQLADDRSSHENDNQIVRFADKVNKQNKKILFKMPLYRGQENLCVYIVNKWNTIISDFIIDTPGVEKNIFPPLTNKCSISPREVTINTENYKFDLCPILQNYSGGIARWQMLQNKSGKYEQCLNCKFKQKYGNRRERSFSLKAAIEYLKNEKISSAQYAINNYEYDEGLLILESLLKVDPCNYRAWELIEGIECQI